MTAQAGAAARPSAARVTFNVHAEYRGQAKEALELMNHAEGLGLSARLEAPASREAYVTVCADDEDAQLSEALSLFGQVHEVARALGLT